MEKFPKITFRSTKIDHKGTDITITGDLTIHGITRPVTLKGEFTAPVTDPWGNARSALAVSTKINRKDWGLQIQPGARGRRLGRGDEVKINVEFEAVAGQSRSFRGRGVAERKPAARDVVDSGSGGAGGAGRRE